MIIKNFDENFHERVIMEFFTPAELAQTVCHDENLKFEVFAETRISLNRQTSAIRDLRTA